MDDSKRTGKTLSAFHNSGMITILLLVIWAVFSLFASDCAAEEAKWELVGFTKHRDALFTDMNRLTSDTDGKVRTWSRITPAERSRYLKQIRRDLMNMKKPVQEFRYLEILNEIDCPSRKISYLQIVYFQGDGRMIHMMRGEKQLSKEIIAGSLWDSLQKTVCNR